MLSTVLSGRANVIHIRSAVGGEHFSSPPVERKDKIAAAAAGAGGEVNDR